MSKYLQAFSTIFLGVCIVAAAWIIAQAMNEEPLPAETNAGFKYELISPNENNLIIFDHETGEYWRTFIETNEGPSTWEKANSPVEDRGN